MAETNEITPGERRELRAVVKQQFAVLRSEVKRREQELKSDIAHQVADHYADRDYQLSQATSAMHRILSDAVKALDEELTNYPAVRVGNFYWPMVRLHDDHRVALTHEAEAALQTRIADAKLRLDRQEADLLRELSIGALGTEQARRFLNAIPSVTELVPSARIAELERQFGDPEP